MDIDGLTCCVGPTYAGYLQRTLPTWLDTLSSVTVVTEPTDKHTQDVCAAHGRVRVVTTDVFTRHGAHFNKGAALDVAYAVMDPIDVVLHFDSDILPPRNWRRSVDRVWKRGTIAGARRYDEQGRKIEDAGDWPYGYFQLWAAADPAVQFWPLFEPWHGHAGNYDMEFLLHWSLKQRADLGCRVTHFGEVRRNWFRTGLPAAEQKLASARMDHLHKVGLRYSRDLAKKPEYRLQVPPFALKLCFDSLDAGWCREMLRACYTDNPFLVAAQIGGAPPEGYERVCPNDCTPDQLRDRIAALAQTPTTCEPSHAPV